MAYDKHTWTCDEPITVERLNHIEDGIADAGGYSCETTTNVVVDESVTTTLWSGHGSGELSAAPSAPTITVTFDNVQYVCPQQNDSGYLYYGATYGDWSQIPFTIDTDGFINTDLPGTYSVKIEETIESIDYTECFGKATRNAVGILDCDESYVQITRDVSISDGGGTLPITDFGADYSWNADEHPNLLVDMSGSVIECVYDETAGNWSDANDTITIEYFDQDYKYGHTFTVRLADATLSVPMHISVIQPTPQISECLYGAIRNNPAFRKMSDRLEYTLMNLVDEYNTGAVRGVGAYASNEVGSYAMALGYQGRATGNNSFACGEWTLASGYNSHAEGKYTIASGQCSHAEGGTNRNNKHTEARGHYSHAEGYETLASGDDSHAEGDTTTASGISSHAEGDRTQATALSSNAEGNGTTASGDYSHSEGTSTVASGNNSHAEGFGTTASGSNAHAEGARTIANHSAQHVFGEFNVADPSTAQANERGTYVEIVGKGTTNSTRSNARTLDWSGNETIAGTLTQSSDKRLKEHIDYLGDDAVEFVRALKPAHYIKDEAHHVGFYAQDVDEADKWNCMTGEMNGYMTLGYTELIAPLVAYCHSLEKRIEELEKKLEDK